MRIVLQIVQLIRVPKAMVANVFVALPSNRMGRRRVWIVALPKILVQHKVPPRDVSPLGQLPKTASVHLLRRGQPSRLEQRRPHVNVRHNFFDHGTTLDHLRAMHQKRHAHRRLVSRPLVDQPLFAELKPVVAHVHHQRRFQQVALPEQIKNSAEIFVHRK